MKVRYNFGMNNPDSRDKLRILVDILRLEERKGFRDDAVIGGIDAFLRRWHGEIGQSLRLPESYSDLSAEQRSLWAKSALSEIGESAPPTSGRDSAVPSRQQRSAQVVPTRSQPAAPASNHSEPPARRQRQRGASGRRKQEPPAAPLRLGDDVLRLGSVNSRTKSRLDNLGIRTVEDLIYHFPHRHDDFTNVRKISEVAPGETQTVKATIWEVSETGQGRRRNAQAILGDETGNIRVVWFNQAYLTRTLKPGRQIVISGMAKVYRGRIVFQSPDYDFFDERDDYMHAGRLVPIYPLTEGLYQRTIRRAAKQALNAASKHIREYVPQDTLRLYDLMDLRDAISLMHYPESAETGGVGAPPSRIR